MKTELEEKLTDLEHRIKTAPSLTPPETLYEWSLMADDLRAEIEEQNKSEENGYRTERGKR